MQLAEKMIPQPALDRAKLLKGIQHENNPLWVIHRITIQPVDDGWLERGERSRRLAFLAGFGRF